MSGEEKYTTVQVPFWVSLVSGGIAGTTVDICFYPLDTVKTRMQSVEGDVCIATLPLKFVV
jgi:solute carrier family 25 S-adenosylmethionine transporter 26